MVESQKKQRSESVEISVELKELQKDDEWPKMAVYVFNRSGHAIAKELLERDPKRPTIGTAKIKTNAKRESLIFKVAPDVADTSELERYQPAVKTLRAVDKPIIEFGIVKTLWICWLKVPYVVTGTVEKAGDNAPICLGEVDIYDVDIRLCFWKIPDIIIERIREGLIDLVRDPPPIELEEPPQWLHYDKYDYCGTPYKIPPRPPVDSDIVKKLEALPAEWAFAKKRFEELPAARAKMDTTMKAMDFVAKSALLNREVVEGVSLNQILYTNTAQFRKLLIDKFQAFRFWLCWPPWIYWFWWPYCRWYSREKLGTAKLQLDGSFTETVWLSVCRHDTPDLWFVVRQKIGGLEKVIYARYPVPCNTYWNHPSGDPVHLVVTDPDAFACIREPEIDLDPSIPWVVPLAIGNHSLKRVYGTGATGGVDKTGLYDEIETHISGDDILDFGKFYDGPFGGLLGLRILFSPALKDAHVKYYRIKYRVEDGDGEWCPLIHEVVRHYSHIDPTTGSLQFKPYSLGPKSEGTENWLFEIPNIDPPETDAEWYVIDATVDLMNGYLDSTKMRIDPLTNVSHGKVKFKIELFKENGERIKPQEKGIIWKLPSNTDVWNTVTTEFASVVNPDLVGLDPEDGNFDNTFIFQLRVDNRKPTAVIDEPKAMPSGNMTHPDCGMLRYVKSDPPKITGDETVTMTYEAKHPEKFGMYRFRLYRSASRKHTEKGQVKSSGKFTVDSTWKMITKLLENDPKPCQEAAFSENLYIWNMAFNGWNRVGPDASAVRAFALAPSDSGP